MNIADSDELDEINELSSLSELSHLDDLSDLDRVFNEWKTQEEKNLKATRSIVSFQNNNNNQLLKILYCVSFFKLYNHNKKKLSRELTDIELCQIYMIHMIFFCNMFIFIRTFLYLNL